MLKLTITTDNAAFEDYGRVRQIATILRDLANRLEDHGIPGKGEPYRLLDLNGNTVGELVNTRK